ncbi:histidine kinase dimerization/phospho-acceptor domain-containing protein [Nautilia sp.]
MEKILSKLTEISDIDWRSLKFKLFFWFGGILLFILIFFGIGFYFIYKENIVLSYKNEFSHIANRIRLTGNLKETGNYKIRIVNKSVKKDRFFINFKEETMDVYYLLKYGGKTVEISKRNLNNKPEDVEDTLLVSIPLLMITLLFAANSLLNGIINPIKEITKKANAVSVDNFPGMIETKYKETEIRGLVNAFNAMIKRIREGIEELDRFNSDIAHELRTPVSVIKAEIQLMENAECNIVKKEIENIEELIKGLLILTKHKKKHCWDV